MADTSSSGVNRDDLLAVDSASVLKEASKRLERRRAKLETATMSKTSAFKPPTVNCYSSSPGTPPVRSAVPAANKCLGTSVAKSVPSNRSISSPRLPSFKSAFASPCVASDGTKSLTTSTPKRVVSKSLHSAPVTTLAKHSVKIKRKSESESKVSSPAKITSEEVPYSDDALRKRMKNNYDDDCLPIRSRASADVEMKENSSDAESKAVTSFAEEKENSILANGGGNCVQADFKFASQKTVFVRKEALEKYNDSLAQICVNRDEIGPSQELEVSNEKMVKADFSLASQKPVLIDKDILKKMEREFATLQADLSPEATEDDEVFCNLNCGANCKGVNVIETSYEYANGNIKPSEGESLSSSKWDEMINSISDIPDLSSTANSNSDDLFNDSEDDLFLSTIVIDETILNGTSHEAGGN